MAKFGADAISQFQDSDMNNIMKKRRFLPIFALVLMLVSTSFLVPYFLTDAFAMSYSPWPSFFHDYSHTRLSEFTGTHSNITRWSFNANHSTTPLVLGENDTIYFGSMNHLYVLNRDGSLDFKVDMKGLVGPPVLGPDGTIYLDNGSKVFFALYPNGKMKWKFESEGIPTIPVIDTYGRIYFGSGNSLYSVSPNGKLLWKYKTDGFVRPPSIGPDGMIYIGDSDHNLYSVDSGGVLRWKFHSDGMASLPSISPLGTIYFCDSDDHLYAINPDGSLKWKYNSSNIDEPPSIGPDGTIYLNNGTGIIAINPKGAFKWGFQPSNAIMQSVMVDGIGNVYVGSKGSGLYVLNPDGKFVWKMDSFGYVGQPVLDSRGEIYFNDGKGTVYSVGEEQVPEFGDISLVFITTIVGLVVISKFGLFKLTERFPSHTAKPKS